jgi:hypothetical protein
MVPADTLPHRRLIADLRASAAERAQAAEDIRGDLEIERRFLLLIRPQLTNDLSQSEGSFVPENWRLCL